MFPYQIMDKLLKLKLELAYKDMSVEQARQHYSELTASKVTSEDTDKPKEAKKVVRRKRIPVKQIKE